MKCKNILPLDVPLFFCFHSHILNLNIYLRNLIECFTHDKILFLLIAYYIGNYNSCKGIDR